MTYQGHIENGAIVLDGPVNLPNGVKVRVELLVAAGETQQPLSSAGTQFDHYQAIIGAIDDLPNDFAAQHDHYIHGTSKK
jgi:hypothetical protein